MKVFFDLDPAVYMSAFAAQKKHYSVVYTDTETDETHQIMFEDGTERRQWMKENEEQEHWEVEDDSFDLIVQPASFACQALKTTVTAAIRKIERKYKTAAEPYYFLTGKGNFREEIATIAKYKGNRDNMEKPVHYEAVREYCVEHFGAYVVEGIEADDEVSIRAWSLYTGTQEDYIVVTIDKDLDQIPGIHYDYKKHVFYEVDALDGELFFYAQVLSGDATDNIKGCYRVGLTKAKKLVEEWFESYAEDQNWRTAIWNLVVEQYDLNMEKYPEQHEHGLSAEEAALENARLVYMQQQRDELWTP